MEQYISWKQWRRSKFAIRRVCALTKFHSVKKLQKLNQNISLSGLWIVVFHCKMLLTNRLSFLDTWRCHIYLFSHSLSVSLWLSVSSYYFLVMFFWVLSPAHTFNRKLAAHKLFHWLLYAFKLELERESERFGESGCMLVGENSPPRNDSEVRTHFEIAGILKNFRISVFGMCLLIVALYNG